MIRSCPYRTDIIIYRSISHFSSSFSSFLLYSNIMFDHANLRPRVLRRSGKKVTLKKDEDGMKILDTVSDSGTDNSNGGNKNQTLFSTTVFGPTCDSIDVVARSVLLPKMEIGDWLYFQNMGAYTMAAASSFNGFTPTERMYVCSVQPEYFEKMIAGPDTE
jgi:ornithine decarboxylase